jgi:release factor glutamine methyltransferase
VTAGETWTPVKVVQWAAGFLKEKGIPGARLDAELLVSHVIGTDRMGVYLQFDRPLDPRELERLRDLIRSRAERQPLAYLLGWREFHRYRFEVTPDVLIPRPETEQLVESAVEFLKGRSEEERTVLDLGTGSGCIALSVASSLPCRVWATDASEAALAVARRNAQRLGGSVEFRRGDWYGALTGEDPGRFDVIVSNPPYVHPSERGELEPEVLREPEGALFPGATGFEAYEAIAAGMSGRLLDDGRAFIELNAKYADKIAGIFSRAGFTAEVLMDLQGLPRTTVLSKKSP